jgi:hypothetical protein
MAKLSATLMLNFFLLLVTAPVLALPEWYTFWAKDTYDCHRFKDGLPEWPKRNADFTARLRYDADKGTVSSSRSTRMGDCGHTFFWTARIEPDFVEDEYWEFEIVR